MFKNKIGIILILCFIFIGLTGCGKSGETKEEKATIIDVNDNKVELSYSELMKEYNNNQTRFTNNYITAEITVTGEIEKIENSNTFNAEDYTCAKSLSYIKLKDGWIVQVFDEHDSVNIDELNSGDVVTITSNIAGINSNIYLASYDGKDCAFGAKPTVVTKK